jgi:hypothetical protein
MADVVSIRPSESIFIDFPIDGDDPIPATMTGEWIIRDKDNIVVGTDSLTKDTEEVTFQMRIKESDTTSLADGTYDLLVKVSDSLTGYADYIYDASLKVKDR